MRSGVEPTVLAFARMAFLELLSYRVRYVVGVLNYVVYMGVQYYLWAAVFASAAERTALGGFTLAELVTYFAVGWVVRVSTFNNIDREIAERVSRGDIALDLLRPVSLLERYYGHAAGEAAFRVFFMGLPTAAVLFPLFGARPPELAGHPADAAGRLAAFLLSSVLAFHVFFLLNFLIGVLAVFFDKIRGLLWAKFILIQFFSGLLVPFDLFPGWARAVLGALPFRAVVHGPASIWLGRLRGGALAAELAVQAVWALALLGSSRWLWAIARRKLLVQGG
ncbi:MAG: ABC transporter permease [Thermoanaerobaculia bacterium]